MTRLESYVSRFGAVAGPKLHHATQSRSAYIGANGRKRAAIAALIGRPTRTKKSPKDTANPMPLLTEPTIRGDQPLTPA